MALFKISKGNSENLNYDNAPLSEGHAWFTPDDGKFYIDAMTDVLQPDDSVVQRLERIALNANKADNDRLGRDIVETYSTLYFYLTELISGELQFKIEDIVIASDQLLTTIKSARDIGKDIVCYFSSEKIDSGVIYPLHLFVYNVTSDDKIDLLSFSNAGGFEQSSPRFFTILYQMFPENGWKVIYNNLLPTTGGTLTGELITSDLDIKGIENFNNLYFKKSFHGDITTNLYYSNLASEYKDGTYHRMWRLKFPSDCSFQGRLKLSLIGGFSGFNASGVLEKTIQCNFNNRNIYNNVGRYGDLGYYVEKDFRISEALWNSNENLWEILIWQKNLNGNNKFHLIVEGWTTALYKESFKGLQLTQAELTQSTGYISICSNYNGGNKEVLWDIEPVFETPLGLEVATKKYTDEALAYKADLIGGKVPVYQLPAAHAVNLHEQVNWVFNKTYTQLSPGQFSANTAYQSGAIGTVLPYHSNYWNNASGTPLDVAFKFTEEKTPVAINVLAPHYNNKWAKIEVFAMINGAMTKIQELENKKSYALIQYQINPNHVTSDTWVIRFTSENGWVNIKQIQILEVTSGIVDNLTIDYFDKRYEKIGYADQQITKITLKSSHDGNGNVTFYI